MGYLISFLIRPLRFCSLMFRTITCRGTRYYIYLKSGRVLKFDADEIKITPDSNGGYRKVEWTHCKMPSRKLVTVDVTQIEAIVFRNW